MLSIHAPTRGATGSDKVNLLTQIFQSTLLQEERLTALLTSGEALAFNPRSYKRSDKVTMFLLNALILSIHAPTRGATQLENGLVP